jgi:transcriptional regulator with XRE-family HTH domain
MQYILENIRTIRVSRKIGQKQIAHAIGMTTSMYSKIETGYQKITLEKFIQIVMFLDVEYQVLLNKKSLEYKHYYSIEKNENTTG